MDRFVPAYDESDEPHYEQLRADPEWNRIYALIRQGYWHVTSLQGWEKIRESGAIKPNRGGRFPMRFGYVSERSYGRKSDLIALFDFATPSEGEVMRQWGNAWDVMVKNREDHILLQLERSSLEGRIIPNSEVFGRSDGKIAGGCIPFVEVWYPEDIPTDCIASVYRLPATCQFEFLPVRLRAKDA
ncbi:MAG: hypothetical protein ACJ8F7_09805 [Gemmataceae bacterium]